MMRAWLAHWLLVALPALGAVVALLLRSPLDRLKRWALSATVATLLLTLGLSWSLGEGMGGLPFLYWLPIAAFLSLLGQPLHPSHQRPWAMTLLFLGLGLGTLTALDSTHHLFLLLLFGLLCALIAQHQEGGLTAWRGLASYGLGVVTTLASLFLPEPASTMAALIACATLFPLLPLHGGYIAVLTGLPGNLPAFLAFLLPVLGFHELYLLLPSLSPTILRTLSILALAGAAYGSLRALIQSRPLPRFAYGAVAFFCMLWWYVGETGAAPVQALVFVGAVGLATSGLVSAWYSIRAHYGDMDLRSLGGMAYPMPRFSTVLMLLALAALGMPPFGVYAGFLGLLLNPAFTPSASLALIVIAWLSASWYAIDLPQQLVFGRTKPGLRYEDLRGTEWASLLLVLLFLLVLGTAPARWFESSEAVVPLSVAMEGSGWTP